MEFNSNFTDTSKLFAPQMGRIVNSGIKVKYRVYVRTGMKLGASTDADVFITLFGTKGRSEEIVLLDSKSHRAKFRKSQVSMTTRQIDVCVFMDVCEN